MAKGDMGGNGGMQAPKIDQYSVMHKIMDMFNGGGNSSIAPSQPPQMGGGMSSMPMGRDNSMQFPPTDNSWQSSVNMYRPPTSFNSPGNWGVTGGNNFGGFAPGSGSLAPQNPQDMIRRSMIGSRNFGQ